MEWNLAYLVGALRDGSVYYDKSRNYKIIWYENNKEWLQKSIAERVFRVFGKYPRIDEYKKGHYRAVLSSKDAFQTIKKDYGFIAPQVKWDTPIKITKSSDAIVSKYIAGYFDAEGDVNPKKYMIGISQKNKDSLDFIRRWLNSKGIKTSKIFIADKRSITNRFYMTSRKNISNFQNLVKFEHPEKIMRLELLLQHT